MRIAAWFVFLTFVGLSAAANYLHGEDAVAGFLLATVPVGFAVVVFLLEGLHAKGKATGSALFGLIVVAAGAGFASYLGLFGMAREHGVQLVPAALLPLAFDGVVLVASLVIRAFGKMPEPVILPERLPEPPNEPVRPEPIPAAEPEPMPEPERPAEPIERTEPNGRTTVADRIILTFGPNDADWPQATELAEALGCSKSTASTARRKAIESLSTAR